MIKVLKCPYTVSLEKGCICSTQQFVFSNDLKSALFSEMTQARGKKVGSMALKWNVDVGKEHKILNQYI